MTTPLPIENRHCPFCGGMVAPRIEFCTHCGNDLPVEAPDAPWLAVTKASPTAVAPPVSGEKST